MTNPQLITTPFAENGTKNIIPEGGAAEPQLATMQAGFPETTQRPINEGGIPPERADFNGILNLYGQHLVHLNKGLPYEFDQDFANSISGYPLNARIMLANGDVVQNTQEGNTNNPNSNMSGWKSSAVSKDVTVPTYRTAADGVDPVTGVADGAYFNVRSSSDESYVDEYQNIGGVPTPTGKTYPSGAALTEVEAVVDNLKTDKIDAVETLAELLNINNPKSGHTAILSGQQGGKFVYNSSRAGENDGGLVFNGWVRTDFETISFSMFACDPTGSTAVDDKLLKICAASTALKKPIHNFTGTYLVNGSADFVFSENTLLDGSVFKLGATFSGRFVIKRDDVESFTLTSGPEFEDLRAVGTILEGQHVLTGASTFNYPDHWAIIETAQPLYIYRGVTKGVKFFTQLLREYRMSQGPYFPVALAQLSAVYLQKSANSVRLYSGFCFDETLAQAVGNYFRVDQSNAFSVRNLRYIDNNPDRRTPNQTRLTTDKCHNFIIDTINETTAFRNSTDTFAYTITKNMSSDVVVRNVKSFGAQAASTGSNNCARVTYEDCLLTRIDFHEPCYDWLKVKNCKVGTMGITATMIGDMFIDDSELCMWQGGSRAFIASRIDLGGFCYGDLHINNLTLRGYNGNSSHLLEAHGNGVMPAGSPISAVMFNNVYINGVYNKTTGARPLGLLMCATASTLLKCPIYIKVDDLTKFSPSVDFGSFAARSELVRLDLLNINHNYMRFDDLNAKGTKVKAKVINANDDGKPVNIVSTANADIDIIDTTLAAYSEYNTAWNSYRPRVSIRGGSVENGNYLALETNVDQKNRITLNGVDVLATPANTNLMLPRARHMDCTFGSDGWVTLWSSAAVVNTGSFTTNMYSGILELVIGWGTQKRIVSIDVRQAGTYNIETGVTVVVTVAGTTSTVTLNATGANLLGISGNI